MSSNAVLAVALLLPIAGALLIAATGKWPNVREAVTLSTAGLLFLSVLTIYSNLQGGTRLSLVLVETLPGLPIALAVEPLGMLFALVASFLWIVTSLYAIGYMRSHGEQHQTRFYICFAVAIASTMGIALAANMFTLFIFYEALTLSTYPLVTHSGTPEARRAGRVYLGLLLGTSIGLQLLAVVWTWALTGTLDFTNGGILRDHASPVVIAILYALYVFGIGKAAIMPFHRWLPAAMVAPTPVSALLHAVAVVKAGVFTILKVTLYIFGIDLLADIGATQWIAYVAAATIILASLVAMRQDNLKARLAYSTVSQLSYVVLGAMLVNAWGIIGAGMHLAMHAFGKITLFFCAGAILVATHKTDVSEMRGLGRRMPITMAAFAIGALSVIGLPPLGGTWSKWYLLLGTLEAGELALLGVLVLSTLLNVAYLMPIPVRAFFSAAPEGAVGEGIKEAPVVCVVALVITAAGSIALFFNPGPLFNLMTQVAGPAP
ncbi:MAG: monovalent cation/H+ antiporter subunit D family protein [Gammaproteobacteria bacterium]|jgi:multicomponent Na+:H+ antiporter subunit D|nr:monovalent cation/H+ antiporter subunit D family protein [Gammaproteobacteria bacterium]